ncbi:MAG TPA: TadE/TadG family type IV pilus assembly protein [Pyrinomonadaceae bacterium]|nr:TadE/TadG family type IV pilus assembly protein [Pyrinomonadaceae bacterium]
MRRLLKTLAVFKRDDRGVQLVELAIAVPVIVVLFAAVAEFGRYFETYATLAKASRVAARYLATASATGADDLSAKNLVVYGNTAGTGQPVINGLTVSNVDIVRRNVDGAVTTGFPSTVTVQIINYKHTPLFDLGKLTKSSLSLNVDVKPSVTMRYLMTESF